MENNSYKPKTIRVFDGMHRKRQIDEQARKLLKYLDAPRYEETAREMLANLYRQRLGIEG